MALFGIVATVFGILLLAEPKEVCMILICLFYAISYCSICGLYTVLVLQISTVDHEFTELWQDE